MAVVPSASPASTASRSVVLSARPRPFELARVHREVPAGLTLAELVDVAIEPAFRGIARVRLAGHPVPREVWARVRPKAGTLVEIVPVPEGGQDGLRIVLMLAVVAAAVTATALTGGTFGLVLGAGISTGGMMAVNTLVPPPMPAAQKQASQTYSIAPAQNSARLREPVKKILGRHRVTLDLAAPWYTEQRGDDQFLHGLLDVGLAPLIVTDLKLGDTPFDQYDQLDYEVLDGSGDAVQSSRLYPGDVVQDGISADLTARYGEVVRPTRDETDQWSVDIAFPQGLQHGHGDGSIDKQAVTFEVRYRTSAVDGNAAGGWSSPARYEIEAESNIPIRRCLPPDGPGDFPARGKYDVGITRLTDDHDNGRILDATTWESLRSINGDAPVTLPGVVRLALKIRASKQLNGQPPAVNCVATSVCPAWDAVSGSWVTDTVNGTRACEALYREVLQGPGQPLTWDDDQIALAALETWGEWCKGQGFTCDYVVDADIATLDLLKIIAAAGRASPMQPDGIWSVAVDGPKTAPVQLLTPRNGSASRWRRIYTEMPHALRVVFVDATQGYKVGAERIVYDDGYDETTATKYLDWQLPGVTDPGLVHRHGRKHLAEMRLRPETWERDVGWEGLVCTRGDWVKASDDTIESGYVSARISLVEASAGRATAITLDDAVVLDGATQVGIAVRLSDGSLWTAPLAPFAGEQHRLALETPVDLAAAGPAPGDLAVVGVRGSETDDLLVIDIRRGPDHTATITAVPLAPAVHTAEDGPIPPWVPVLALPAGSVAPVIWQVSSDDAVLTRDADGAYHVSMVVAFYRDGAAPLEKYTAVKVEWQEVGTGHPARSQEWPSDVQTARVHDVILGETYEVRACYRLRADLVAKGHPAYGPWSGTKTHFLDGPQLPPPDVGAPYLAGDRVVWSYPDPPPDFAGFAVRIVTAAGQSWDQGQNLTDGLYPTAYVLLAEIPVSAAELLVRAEDATGNLSAGTARVSVLGVPRPKVVDIAAVDYAAQGFPGVIVGGQVTGGPLPPPTPAVTIAVPPSDVTPELPVVGGTPVATLAAGFGTVTPSRTFSVPISATVAIDAASATDVSVGWAITGLAAADVVGGVLSGRVIVPAGQTSAPLTATLAAQSLAADKAGTLTLSSPTGCTLGSPASRAFTLAHNVVAVGIGDVPAPLRTLNVTTSTLAGALAGTSALGALRPGDHLCMAAGTYAGFAVPAALTGTDLDPIVLRSGTAAGLVVTDAPQAAIVNGNVTVNGQNVTLRLLKTTGGGGGSLAAHKGSIQLVGAGSEAQRCLIDTPEKTLDGILMLGPDQGAHYNEIRACANIGIAATQGARRPSIQKNHCHAPATGGMANSLAGIMVGMVKEDSLTDMRSVTKGNFVTGYPQDGIEFKSSNNSGMLNTVTGDATNMGMINIRHGLGNVLASNFVRDGVLTLGDGNNIAVKNHTEGTHNGPGLAVKAGNITGDQLRAGTSGYPYAQDARVILHDGAVFLGWKNPRVAVAWDKPALRTSVEACAGTVTTLTLPGGGPAATGTRSTITTTYSPLPPAPVELTSADVGPAAA